MTVYEDPPSISWYSSTLLPFYFAKRYFSRKSKMWFMNNSKSCKNSQWIEPFQELMRQATFGNNLFCTKKLAVSNYINKTIYQKIKNNLHVGMLYIRERYLHGPVNEPAPNTIYVKSFSLLWIIAQLVKIAISVDFQHNEMTF